MKKNQFIRILRQKLLESISSAEAEAQVRYYEEYIREEIKNGRREEDILAELGDPVLIARTILEAPGRRNDDQSPKQYTYDRDAGSVQTEKSKRMLFKHISNFGCILSIILTVLILFFVFRLVGAIVGMVFRVLAPVILVVVLIVLIKNLNRR